MKSRQIAKKGKKIDKRNFFYTDLRPLTTMFGFSLRNSILVISSIDVLAGLVNFVRFVQYTLLLYMGSQSFQDILVLMSFFTGALSLVFAFNSVKSVLILKPKYLYHYSIYKQFEFILQMVIWVIYEVIEFNRGFISYPMILYIFITRMMFFYLAWIIWSAYSHILNGNTFIVIEGKIMD